MKDAEDRNCWIIDEDAAAVVRRIFAMTVEGMGPYRIAKILSDEKVEKPSYYQAVRGRGCYKNQCDFEHPYAWMGVSIVRMLEKPEYMGDTVNFRSRKQNDKKCSSHCIQEDAVKQFLLETIRYACDSVHMDEEAFMDAMRSASAVRDMGEVKKLKAGLKTREKRISELDMLLKKVYEDNAMGKLPDRRYEMLSSDYEKEQQELEISMQEMREKIAQFEDDTDRTEKFLSLVHKYTDIRELTAP